LRLRYRLRSDKRKTRNEKRETINPAPCTMQLEDEILKFLISLADIRKHTEAVFPLARKFVRPGFDQ
jgi:hypothetical protein